MNMPTRRRFLQQFSTASLAAGIGIRASRLVRAARSTTDWPIAIFEKVLEGLSYEELADAIAQIGADGVEATIRPKGHIEPEAAADEVPKMAEAMRARGKQIVIAATHIRNVDEPHTESLLRTLKTVGITHYRMGHYYLELDGLDYFRFRTGLFANRAYSHARRRHQRSDDLDPPARVRVLRSPSCRCAAAATRDEKWCKISQSLYASEEGRLRNRTSDFVGPVRQTGPT
jgi:hypothetical protein